MSTFKQYDAELNLQYHIGASGIMDKNLWVVTSPFVYRVRSGKKGYVSIPTGYISDGASAPTITFAIVPPWGVYGQAAVLHDYLCEYGIINNLDGSGVTYINRKRADEIFLEAMEDLDVPYIQRTLMYWGVCLYRTINQIRKPRKDPIKALIIEAIQEYYSRTQSFTLDSEALGALNTKISLFKE